MRTKSSTLVFPVMVLGNEEVLLPFTVLSLLSHGFEKRDSPEFQEYWDKHQHQCQANYTGSSPSMEMHGAVILWKWSLDYNLRYLTFIGDGDSKSFKGVCEAVPSGPEYSIEKSDCIGHVQKRMGSALRKIKRWPHYWRRRQTDRTNL